MSAKKATGRLLIILPDLAPGGAQPMSFRIGSCLARHQWKVTIAVLFSRQGLEQYELDYPDVNVIRMGADQRRRRIGLPFRLAWIARNADVVLAGLELASTNYGFFASILSRKPFISWTHTIVDRHIQAASVLDKYLSMWVYRHVRHVVFPSKGACESVAKAIGGKPKGASWHVIENFCDFGKFHDLMQGPLTSLIFSKPVIISIGRLVPEKSQDRLLRAHRELQKQGLDHHLLILGEGPRRADLEKDVRTLGVSSTVFMPGHVSNASEWLRRATIFALCSDYEGLPLALIEALHEGVPVVSMDCPTGPREILQDGEAGLLTPPGDEAAFCCGLLKLLRSPELRARYSRRGRKRANYYSAGRIIPIWQDLLDNVHKSHEHK